MDPASDPAEAALRDVVGGRVHTLRSDLGWSVRKLAAESGVSLGTIGNIERAEREPGIDKIDKIARALGVTLAELVKQ